MTRNTCHVEQSEASGRRGRWFMGIEILQVQVQVHLRAQDRDSVKVSC